MQRTIPTLNSIEPFINYMVPRFSRAFDLERDEIKSNAYFSYMKSRVKYKPNKKVKFTTYLHKATVNECLVSKSEKKEELTSDQITFENQTYNVNPESAVIFKDILENLSTDSRKVINMILN